MAATTISRTAHAALVDDDGTNTLGSIWNKAAIASVILDAIDALFTTDLTISRSSSGDITFSVANAANTAGSDAILSMSVGGSSAGDPHAVFGIAGVLNWNLGVDNSDSDKFVIGIGATPGASNAIEIDTSLGVRVNATTGHGIGGAGAAGTGLRMVLTSTASGTLALGLDIRGVLTAAVNSDVLAFVNVGQSNTIATAGFGSLNAYGARFVGSGIAMTGAGNVGVAATVYIGDAPTIAAVAANNYALFVDSGKVRIDGRDATNVSVASGRLLINVDGTDYYIGLNSA
jgi:hypothetical protein